jgi:ethanolamine utilization protein EutN
MKLCKVIGFATASLKVEGFSPYKMVIVKSINDHGSPVGDPFLAIDTFGAGLSEVVAVVTGAPATNALADKGLPVDAAVIGLLDHISINKKEIYSRHKEG